MQPEGRPSRNVTGNDNVLPRSGIQEVSGFSERQLDISKARLAFCTGALSHVALRQSLSDWIAVFKI